MIVQAKLTRALGHKYWSVCLVGVDKGVLAEIKEDIEENSGFLQIDGIGDPGANSDHADLQLKVCPHDVFESILEGAREGVRASYNQIIAAMNEEYAAAAAKRDKEAETLTALLNESAETLSKLQQELASIGQDIARITQENESMRAELEQLRPAAPASESVMNAPQAPSNFWEPCRHDVLRQNCPECSAVPLSDSSGVVPLTVDESSVTPLTVDDSSVSDSANGIVNGLVAKPEDEPVDEPPPSDEPSSDHEVVSADAD